MLNERYTIYSIYLNTHYIHLHILILEYLNIYNKCHLYLNPLNI